MTRTPTARTGRLPLWAAVVVALVCGVLMATQSRVNGELGERLGDGFSGALLSFSIGLVIVIVIAALTPSARRGTRALAQEVRAGRLPAWTLLGGVGGALFVLSQGLATAIIGVSLFTVALIGGQTVSGLIVDRLGLGPGGKRALTARRLVGAAIALVVVAWSVGVHVRPDIPLWMLVLPLIAGVCVAVQQAANGRVAGAARSAVVSTLTNFIAGTIVLLLAAIVHAAVTGSIPTALPADWWLYLGGPLGVTFIFGLATAVRVTGVLILGLCTVAGQLGAALAFDVLAPEPGRSVDWTTPIAAVLIVLAVIVVTLPSRRRGANSDAPETFGAKGGSLDRSAVLVGRSTDHGADARGISSQDPEA
jgi:transporter family-2 protein